MKRYILILALAVTAFLPSCRDHEDIVFDDYYVCIKDETGVSSGIVSQTSNNFVTTYYVYMTAPKLDRDVIVTYELEVGDGLSEGVDFRVQETTRSPLVFTPGTTRLPIRFVWLKHELDPARNNSVTIRLTSCSEGYLIGYPGPAHRFDAYTVTKQ